LVGKVLLNRYREYSAQDGNGDHAEDSENKKAQNKCHDLFALSSPARYKCFCKSGLRLLDTFLFL
jgi:hypothetical protein